MGSRHSAHVEEGGGPHPSISYDRKTKLQASVGDHVAPAQLTHVGEIVEEDPVFVVATHGVVSEAPHAVGASQGETLVGGQERVVLTDGASVPSESGEDRTDGAGPRELAGDLPLDARWAHVDALLRVGCRRNHHAREEQRQHTERSTGCGQHPAPQPANWILATEWLGPRTELEIQQTLQREVEQERWTSLDRTLQREAGEDGRVQIERFNEPRLQRQRLLLIGRLQRLQRLGLADDTQPGTWAVHADAEKTLRALGERGDIIRTMQRAMRGEPRELAVFEPGDDGRTILGRVAAKGLADELRDRGYLVIDGVDGKAHYVALNTRDELANYPAGAVVEVKGSADVRAADRNIAALASDGLYRTDHHLAVAQGPAVPGRDPQEVVTAHVRRLEALRRAGIVERMAEGLWKVPGDLPEQGRRYDAQRLGGVAVELKSHLPIERQVRVIGATWLDQQLIGGSGLGDLGFGAEAKQAMQQRADFLAEQGLAERRGQRVILARNLLDTLRSRELSQVAKDIAAETGLEHRPVTDGQRVAGIYRRNVMLASGRYAMLDDGLGFSLVPWKPVIEQRLGQQLAATVSGGGVAWEIGRQRGMGIG